MGENDGLYLGVALLGGAVLLSQQEGGITGGGLGETIREQIESVIAIPQTIKSTTERIIQTGTDLNEKITDFNIDDIIPDNPFAFDLGNLDLSPDSLQKAGNNAGQATGGSIGGFLGGAILGMYQGAAVSGAHFVGRNDVNMSNVNQKFMSSASGIKDNFIGAGSALVKGLVFGGNAADAAKLLSGSVSGGSSGGSGIKLNIKAATVQNPIRNDIIKTNGRTISSVVDKSKYAISDAPTKIKLRRAFS